MELAQLPLAQLDWLAPLQQALQQQHRAQRTPHALLFCGSSGLGQPQLLGWLSQLLLCRAAIDSEPCGQCHSCQLLLAGHHPDLHRLSPNDKGHILIQPVRALQQVLNETAQQGGARVAWIQGVERMNTHAANALLKTLEEPARGVYLLLECRDPQRLLPTISSRCQHWSIPSPTTERAQHWLKTHGLEVDPRTVALHRGAPFAVAEFIRQGEAEQFSQLAKVAGGWLRRQCSEQTLLETMGKEVYRSACWLQWLLNEGAKQAPDQRARQRWSQMILLLKHALPQMQQPGINATLLMHSTLTQMASVWQQTNEDR